MKLMKSKKRRLMRWRRKLICKLLKIWNVCFGGQRVWPQAKTKTKVIRVSKISANCLMKTTTLMRKRVKLMGEMFRRWLMGKLLMRKLLKLMSKLMIRKTRKLVRKVTELSRPNGSTTCMKKIVGASPTSTKRDLNQLIEGSCRDWEFSIGRISSLISAHPAIEEETSRRKTNIFWERDRDISDCRNQSSL